MATFHVVPAQAPQTPDIAGNFAQLLALARRKRLDELAQEEANLRLAALRRLERDAELLRSAQAAGIRQVPTMQQEASSLLGGAAVPVPGPPEIRTDTGAILQQLAQTAPHLVPEMEASLATQQQQQQVADLELAERLAKLDDAAWQRTRQMSEDLGNQLAAFQALPEEVRARIWPQVRQAQPPQIREQLPAEYPGAAWVEAQAAGTERWKRIMDAVAEQRRLALTERPLPGRDVPLPPEVEAQRQRMERPATEPGSYMPLTDELGRIVGAWNPKTGRVEKLPEELAGARRSGLAGTELNRRAILEQMASDMQRAGELAEKFRGTPTIGFGTGKAGSIGRRIFGGDPDAIDLERLLNNAADILLRARSGAQINEQEYRRLRALLPSLNESEDSFFTKLKSFQSEVNQLAQRTTAPETAGRREAPKDPLGIR